MVLFSLRRLDEEIAMDLIWWVLKIVAALWVLYFLVRFIKAAAKMKRLRIIAPIIALAVVSLASAEVVVKDETDPLDGSRTVVLGVVGGKAYPGSVGDSLPMLTIVCRVRHAGNKTRIENPIVMLHTNTIPESLVGLD
jgi:hypothetical protein